MNKAYDSINKTKLIEILRKKVQDKLLMRIITQMILKSNTKILESYVNKDVPQGGSLSP